MSYIQTVIREAVKTAGIWETALTLDEVTASAMAKFRETVSIM